MECPKCQSEQIVKRGIRLTERREKIQKYYCKSCNYRFSLDNPFFRMRNHQQITEKNGWLELIQRGYYG